MIAYFASKNWRITFTQRYKNDFLDTSREEANSKQCTFFITTHSHTIIDIFSRDPEAQILRVMRDASDSRVAKVSLVASQVEQSAVFDDLGVRASDLLQSNCVIWVEGPSDRIYVNTWMKLVAPELVEHEHYEFAFTAGSLLKHLMFDQPTAVEANIEALRINRNAIILMDSDLGGKRSELKPNARRVFDELERSGGYAWITYGKEVENYIPLAAFRQFVGDLSLPEPDLHTDMFGVIRKSGKPDYRTNKAELAQTNRWVAQQRYAATTHGSAREVNRGP